MEIGSDLASTNNDDLRREEGSGAYLYKINDKRFEVNRFNRRFKEYKMRREEEKERKMKEKLDQLNRPPEKTPPYLQPLGRIAIDSKDALFDILDETLQGNLSSQTFLVKNRMFYLGITLIVISMLTFFYLMIIG